MSTKYLLKRFYPYFKPYLHILLFDLFCASLTSVCDLVLPLIVRFITNTITTSPSDLTLNLIVRLTLLYIALRIIDVSAPYLIVRNPFGGVRYSHVLNPCRAAHPDLSHP